MSCLDARFWADDIECKNTTGVRIQMDFMNVPTTTFITTPINHSSITICQKARDSILIARPYIIVYESDGQSSEPCHNRGDCLEHSQLKSLLFFNFRAFSKTTTWYMYITAPNKNNILSLHNSSVIGFPYYKWETCKTTYDKISITAGRQFLQDFTSYMLYVIPYKHFVCISYPN